MDTLGRSIIFLGILLVILGIVLTLFSRLPFLKSLGHLPGDIRYESEHLSCYFPLVTMIILSILVSIIINVVLRLFNR